jgi:hypothetical protein
MPAAKCSLQQDELQAAMRDRHWTDFACSRRFRRLGSRRGELVGLLDLVAVQRAAGYNTGLAKVTTNDKALPCSRSVCALRPSSACAAHMLLTGVFREAAVLFAPVWRQLSHADDSNRTAV